jgi:mono/diheme cytochrome c family protein
MKTCVLMMLFMLVAGYAWSPSRPLPQEPPPKKVQLSSEDLARAKSLFGGKCARCHGSNGRGQTVLGQMLSAPDFTDWKWWKDHDKDRELIKSITNGNGDMPTFGKKLSKTEISLLASYVRQFSEAEQSGTPAQKILSGQANYAQ